MRDMNEQSQPYPWKTLAVLTAAATLTSPLVFPYMVGLAAIAPHAAALPAWSWTAIVLASMLRSLVVFGLATALGFLVARRIGLGAPWLEHWLDGAPRPARPASSIVLPALGWATATAFVAFGIDALFLHGWGVTLPAPEIHARIAVVWWRSGLASFWAPFAEEILDRLFLLSLLAWLLTRLFRVRGDGRGRTAALWTANVATALFFGWYHLSNEQMFAAVLPPLVVLRTILIILPVGLAFGWLYFRRGLEAAILAHFAIDLIVHVVRPLLAAATG
jgi:membrane protease YdiL (CAAX protease family)